MSNKIITIQFLAGLVLSILISVKSGFLDGETGLSLIGVVGVLVAVYKYLDERERERRLSIIEHLDRFKKIVSLKEKYIALVKDKIGSSYNDSRLGLIGADLDKLLASKDSNFLNQLKVHDHFDLSNKEIIILNEMEVLAASILIKQAQDDDSLGPIKVPFIQTAEEFGATILMTRNFTTGKSAYANLLKLYEIWINQGLDTRTTEERIIEFKKIVKKI